MKATKSPRKVVSGNPSPSKTRATNRDDDESKSISQLLQLLESQLDRHIDDNRYASLIVSCSRQEVN